MVSVHWLVHSRDADAQIEGDRAFRINGGYQRLTEIFRDELKRLGVPIHLDSVVRAIRWRRGGVEVETTRGDSGAIFTAGRALITLPLGVLQAPESIRFEPALPEAKQAALRKLAMGRVVRVTLCFRERFWEKLRGRNDSHSLRDLSFLFSRDDVFPTWWTQMPEPVPVITGWAPARSAESLAGVSEDGVIDHAVEALSRLLQIAKAQVQAQLRAAYYHDWDADPFSRGAYSYVKVGGEGCQGILGSPVEHTLFFAGEATDTSGHNGTVHGAIASGQRASREMLKS
jgi:monoamine oxidase